MSNATPQDSIVCTVTVTHPLVCGRPATRITIGRADKPGDTIIDWTQMTAFRHHHAELAQRLESGWKTQVLSREDLKAIMALASFNAWPEPVAPANPRPSFIDFLPQPKFMRQRRV